MSRILTPGQTEELHKSIIAYLTSTNLSKSATALREELNIGDSFSAATSNKYEGLLEKKWTSVVRLQKKIMGLESTIASLQAELDSITPASLSKQNQDPTSWLPGSRARHTLRSHRQPITCVAFHPIFSSLASGSEDFTIKIWDWELGELERTLKGHTRAVTDVDFGGPKGRTLLASCSTDLTVKLWDPSNDYTNIRTLFGHDHSVSALRFLSSPGNLLVSARYCVKTIRGHNDWVRDVSPSFDGKWLVSGGNERTAMIWDALSGEAKATLIGHENFIECCAFAPPASYGHLATLAGRKKPPPSSSSAEFVATGARDKSIKIWDVQGALIKTLIGHDNWVRGLVFHPGGKYLISAGDDKTLRCWDLSQEGKLVKTLEGVHERFVSCIRWAPTVVNDVPEEDGERTNTALKKEDAGKAKIRCAIATGCVDSYVRVFVT
ncbi:nuclear distribution protein PAC1-1 [Bisporella sp. PMI_857]|nr:nuclear distribution protein PAC1-1 [Bisporella sp. PMI_857]